MFKLALCFMNRFVMADTFDSPLSWYLRQPWPPAVHWCTSSLSASVLHQEIGREECLRNNPCRVQSDVKLLLSQENLIVGLRSTRQTRQLVTRVIATNSGEVARLRAELSPDIFELADSHNGARLRYTTTLTAAVSASLVLDRWVLSCPARNSGDTMP